MQSPKFPHGSTYFFIYHPPPPRIFMKRRVFETNIIPLVCSFYFNTETMRIYVLGLQSMPEKAHTTANFSLLSSPPPPTSEVVIDKIPHPTAKCHYWNPLPQKTIAFHGRGGAFLLKQPLCRCILDEFILKQSWCNIPTRLPVAEATWKKIGQMK